MKTATVAYAKSHLSAVLAEVEAGDAGEGIVITRRGMPVARLVPEPRAGGFDWAELRHWVSAPPTSGLTVAEMREQDLL
jgi:prevent-host-death family protein